MSYNIFDVVWKLEDPLGRTVVLQNSVIDSRKLKHTSEVEFLPAEDIAEIITNPTRIDRCADPDHNRNTYLMYNDEYEYKYGRVTVTFDDDNDEGNGLVISWSRYIRPTASYGVLYSKENSDRK